MMMDDGSQPDSSDPVDRLIELLGLTDKFAALFDTLPLHELPEDGTDEPHGRGPVGRFR